MMISIYISELPRGDHIVAAKDVNPQRGYYLGDQVNEWQIVFFGPHSKRLFDRANIGDTIRYGIYHNTLIRNGSCIATEIRRDAKPAIGMAIFMLIPAVSLVSLRKHNITRMRSLLTVIAVIEGVSMALLVMNISSWLGG